MVQGIALMAVAVRQSFKIDIFCVNSVNLDWDGSKWIKLDQNGFRNSFDGSKTICSNWSVCVKIGQFDLRYMKWIIMGQNGFSKSFDGHKTILSK